MADIYSPSCVDRRHRFKVLKSYASILQHEMEEIMQLRQFACGVLSSIIVLGCGLAAAAEDAPKDNKAYTTPKTVTIDLDPEIPSMAGWQLRLRMLKIEPGGHIGLHNHKDRPAVVYFHEGTDVVTNEDGSSKTFKPGDTTAEGVKTVHWHKNVGDGNVIIFTADLVKSAK